MPIARKIASEHPRGHFYLGLLGAVSNIGSALGGLVLGKAYDLLGLSKSCILGLCIVDATLYSTLWCLILLIAATVLATRRGR